MITCPSLKICTMGFVGAVLLASGPRPAEGALLPSLAHTETVINGTNITGANITADGIFLALPALSLMR